MGRQTIVNLSDVRKLAQLHCTQKEAAGQLSIGVVSFRKLLKDNDKVKVAWEQGLEQGKVSLRRKQSNLATNSAPMAIWLGKQYLGQDDKQTVQHTGADGGPIETVDVSQLNTDERRQLRKLLTVATTLGSRQG